MIPTDAWPAGDLLEWGDDETRIHHDFFNETVRPYTDEENAAADERAVEATLQANDAALRAQAIAALATNRAFLALSAPTNVQTLAQVRHLTKVVNALGRLQLGDLTGTD
jgi:hypothetical protein